MFYWLYLINMNNIYLIKTTTISICYVFFLVFSFWLGTVFEENNQLNSINQSTPQITNNTSEKTCSRFGEIPRDEFADIYIVKPGDSLLSIARNQLGDFSRANEIINMNDSDPVNPNISKWKSLSSGTKIYLPPKNVSKSSGMIFAWKGQVKFYKNNRLVLKFSPTEGGSPEIGFTIDVTKDTKFLGDQTLHVGDCVFVIVDNLGIDTPSGSNKALVITHQL